MYPLTKERRDVLEFLRTAGVCYALQDYCFALIAQGCVPNIFLFHAMTIDSDKTTY